MVITLCIYLIYEQVGVAAFAGFGYEIFTFILSWWSFSNIFNLRKSKLTCTDERSKLTNEVLSGIRILRLYGWKKAFIEKFKRQD